MIVPPVVPQPPAPSPFIDPALTTQQSKALDTRRNVVLTAGAGSGKTRVLTERYLALLDPDRPDGALAPDNILTITFTNKAATQMRARIQARVDLLLGDPDLDGGRRAHWQQVKDDLTSAPISTIHAFCGQLLRAHALEAGLDPQFGVLEEADVDEARNAAVDAAMAAGGQCRADALAVLEHWSRYQLQAALLGLLQRRQVALPWCRQLAEEAPDGAEPAEAALLQSVARLFIEALGRFQRGKRGGSALDFDDLEQQAARLLHREPAALAACRERFRYVMVDEFQDTNEVQWAIIRKLVAGEDGGLAPDRLFVVGDPQQSIFAFRGADVSVFQRVIGEVKAANERHGATELPFHDPRTSEELASTAEERAGCIAMGDNFRGTPLLIDLSNYLFQQLMDPQANLARPFEALFTPLIARRAGASTIEFLLADRQDGEPAAAGQAALIARRLRGILDEGKLQVDTGEGYRAARPGDMAILLKRRRYLPYYEQALRDLGVPYRVTGGVGFYRAPEVQDLANLLQALLHARRDIPLAGVLRSPVFGLSDEGLYWVARAAGDGLAEKLNRLNTAALGEADAAAVARARELLPYWRAQSTRMPPAEFLQALLAESGLWAAVQAGERGPQGQANLEKLLHRCRAMTRDGWATLADFADRVLQLMRLDEREGEAPVLLEGEDTVKLLTVHAAKGLEFPIVAVPELEMAIRQRGDDGPLAFDAAEGLAARVLILPAGRRTKYALEFAPRGQQLQALLADKALAEQKRLFYVALTRARDHLILAGTPPSRQADSWWRWFAGFFGDPGSEPLAFGWQGRRHTIPVTREIPVPPAGAAVAAVTDLAAAPADLVVFRRWAADLAPLAPPPQE